MFSVCVLLYGDHPALAARCLGSIVRSADWKLVADLRVGMNEVSAATEAAAAPWMAMAAEHTKAYAYRPERNVGKYPLMRRMFQDAGLPLAQRTMWFDDDSFIDPPEEAWWGKVAGFMDHKKAELVGSLYRLRHGFRPAQMEAIQKQPWHKGLPMATASYPIFATGGWWAVSSAILQRHSYPFPEIHHNGGDSLLGELCHQQGYRISHYNEGVKINYGGTRGESGAKRRGMTSPLPYERPFDRSIHDFRCVTTAHVAVERQET